MLDLEFDSLLYIRISRLCYVMHHSYSFLRDLSNILQIGTILFGYYEYFCFYMSHVDLNMSFTF